MKPILGVCLIALATCGVVAAQDPTAPVMRPGVSVELPVSTEAIAMPEADRQDVTVVAITADGNLYAGKQPIALAELAGLTSSTVYVKADARASFQQVLTVVSALSNHPVVLLTQPTAPAEAGKLSPPYGVSLAVGQR